MSVSDLVSLSSLSPLLSSHTHFPHIVIVHRLRPKDVSCPQSSGLLVASSSLPRALILGWGRRDLPLAQSVWGLPLTLTQWDQQLSARTMSLQDWGTPGFSPAMLRRPQTWAWPSIPGLAPGMWHECLVNCSRAYVGFVVSYEVRIWDAPARLLLLSPQPLCSRL